MLITADLLQRFNGIYVDKSDESEIELINIFIGAAQQAITNYVGYDAESVIATESEYSESTKQLFKLTCLRIATLLQSERDSNIGIGNSSEPGVTRSFLNVVDYTPYLQQLSAFRKDV